MLVNYGFSGYVRLVALMLSMYFATTAPYYTVLLYLTNVVLDDFDGIFARKLNQS